MDFSALYTLIAAIFLMLCSGIFLRKTNVINDASSKNISKLVLTFAQPALIISSLNSITVDLSDPASIALLKKAVLVFLIGVGLHFVLAILAYFSVKFVKDLDERKIMEFGLLYSNCGFVGLPVLESIFGKEGIFLGAFYLISFHLTLWSWGISILARKREDIKISVKKIFLNYGSVPSYIGIVLFIIKIFLPIPEFLTTTLSYIGSLCTPLSLLIAGALIGKLGLKEIFLNAKLYVFSFFRLIAFPVLTAVLMKLFGFDSQLIVVFTAIIALPSASTVTMLAETYDIKPEFSSLTVGMSTILSVVTIPLVISIGQLIAEI